MFILGIVLAVAGVLAMIPGTLILISLQNPELPLFGAATDTLGVSLIFFGAIAVVAGVLLFLSSRNEKTRAVIKNIIDKKEFTLVIVIAVVVYMFWAMNHNYLSLTSIRGIFNSGFVMGILAVGIGCLMISGMIDLSTGSTGMLAGILIAFLLNANVPWVPAVLIILVFGVVTGLANAFFVNFMNMVPFISSLAIGTIFSGVALIITKAANIPISNKSFMSLGLKNIGVFPLPFFIAIILIIIYGIIMANTGFGRRVYMTGGHANAARLAGINPKKITTILFVNNSVIACLAGALMTSRMNMGSPSSVHGSDLDAITAVVLGGVAFMGGSGNLFGVFLGVVLISCFQTGLTVIGFNPYYQVVAKGLLLVAALVLDFFREKARMKSMIAAH